MTQRKNNDEYQKFWFGFAVGSAVCGMAAVAVGTKQGRDWLKKTLHYMENIEGTPDQIHLLTDAVQTFTQIMLQSQAPDARPEPATQIDVPPPATSMESAPAQTPTTKAKAAPPEDLNLTTIIDRMRNMTAGKKTEQKFFKKPKK